MYESSRHTRDSAESGGSRRKWNPTTHSPRWPQESVFSLSQKKKKKLAFHHKGSAEDRNHPSYCANSQRNLFSYMPLHSFRSSARNLLFTSPAMELMAPVEKTFFSPVWALKLWSQSSSKYYQIWDTLWRYIFSRRFCCSYFSYVSQLNFFFVNYIYSPLAAVAELYLFKEYF